MGHAMRLDRRFKRHAYWWMRPRCYTHVEHIKHLLSGHSKLYFVSTHSFQISGDKRERPLGSPPAAWDTLPRLSVWKTEAIHPKSQHIISISIIIISILIISLFYSLIMNRFFYFGFSSASENHVPSPSVPSAMSR